MFKAANVGTVDRILRLLVGAILIALPFVMPDLELWATAAYTYGALIVGGVLVFTALVRFCPAYSILGVSTCGR